MTVNNNNTRQRQSRQAGKASVNASKAMDIKNWFQVLKLTFILIIPKAVLG
jgi:hypothetical protein